MDSGMSSMRAMRAAQPWQSGMLRPCSSTSLSWSRRFSKQTVQVAPRPTGRDSTQRCSNPSSGRAAARRPAPRDVPQATVARSTSTLMD